MLTVSARTCQGLCASSADQTYWKEGKAAPVMLRFHRKYGNLSNREISKVVGLVEQYAVTPTVFANAAAGKGARFVRCAIAIALDELPSILWPFLTEKTRQADDDLYLSSIEDTGGLHLQSCGYKPSHTVQGRFEYHPSSFIAGIVPCAVFCAWTQPHGVMPPKDGTPVYHGCHAVAFLGAPAPRHGNPLAFNSSST